MTKGDYTHYDEHSVMDRIVKSLAVHTPKNDTEESPDITVNAMHI